MYHLQLNRLLRIINLIYLSFSSLSVHRDTCYKFSSSVHLPHNGNISLWASFLWTFSCCWCSCSSWAWVLPEAFHFLYSSSFSFSSCWKKYKAELQQHLPHFLSFFFCDGFKSLQFIKKLSHIIIQFVHNIVCS